MKLTLKEKAKLFWERNKADIIGWLVAAGVITGIGAAGAYLIDKQVKKEEAEVERAKKELVEKLKEAEAEEERIMNDPENQIAGGYVNPNNDNLEEPVYPNILVNTVPVANMGELGEAVIERLNREWFGEFLETGEENPFSADTATVDVYIDFGHEVWKRNHSEEAESQEKQAS